MRIPVLMLGLLLPMLAATPALAQSGATKPATTASAPATSPAELLDINHATAAQLEPLKGIGPARAAAIVKGRPYKGKDELVEKKIIPKSVYDDIKDKIIAKQN